MGIALPLPRDASATGSDAPVALREVTHLEVDGRSCRLVCVDLVVPRQHAVARNARPRLIFADGEVSHFDLDGHRYALVPCETGAQADAPEVEAVHRLLTNRELQIVQLICMGCLTKQVADRLHLSEFTVRSYLKTVYAKLGVRSRGAMVYRYAQTFAHTAADRG